MVTICFVESTALLHKFGLITALIVVALVLLALDLVTMVRVLDVIDGEHDVIW